MTYFGVGGYLYSYCPGAEAPVFFVYGPTTNYGNTFQATYNTTYGGYPAFANAFPSPIGSGPFNAAAIWHYQSALVLGTTNYSGDQTFTTDGYPTFVVQPQSQTVVPGGSATFTVTVVSVFATTFQWMTNGVPIPGATSVSGNGAASYTFTNALPANNGLTVSVTASNGATLYVPLVTSTNAVLTVLGPPTLNATLNGGQIVLSWPTSATNYVLQTRAGISSSSWSTATGTLATNGTTISLTRGAQGPPRFFRLMRSQ